MTAVVYPGKATQNEQSVAAKDMINQKAHRMTFEMDRDLHARLKLASAVEHVYIKDILVRATTEWLEKRGH